MLNNIIDVEGVKYMSAQAAAGLWGISVSTVRKYCRDEKIQGCFKLNNTSWYIKMDTMKPLSETEIHRLLVLTIQLKNDPSLQIDWDTFDFPESAIRKVYMRLYAEGYIKPITSQDEKKIPYEVVLTQRGIEVATTFNKNESKEFREIIMNWGPIILQACLQLSDKLN